MKNLLIPFGLVCLIILGSLSVNGAEDAKNYPKYQRIYEKHALQTKELSDQLEKIQILPEQYFEQLEIYIPYIFNIYKNWESLVGLIKQKMEKHYQFMKKNIKTDPVRAKIELSYTRRYERLLKALQPSPLERLKALGEEWIEARRYPAVVDLFQKAQAISAYAKTAHLILFKAHFSWTAELFVSGDTKQAREKLILSRNYRLECPSCLEYEYGYKQQWLNQAERLCDQGMKTLNPSLFKKALRLLNWIQDVDPEFKSNEVKKQIELCLKDPMIIKFKNNYFLAIKNCKAGNFDKAKKYLNICQSQKFGCPQCEQEEHEINCSTYNEGIALFRNGKYPEAHKEHKALHCVAPEYEKEKVSEYLKLADLMAKAIEEAKSSHSQNLEQAIQTFEQAINGATLTGENSHLETARKYIVSIRQNLYNFYLKDGIDIYNNKLKEYGYQEGDRLNAVLSFEKAAEHAGIMAGTPENKAICREYIKKINQEFLEFHYQNAKQAYERFHQSKPHDKRFLNNALHEFKLVESLNPEYKDTADYIRLITKLIKQRG